MAATITTTGRITRTPRTSPRTGTPGNAWATVAGALAYGIAWIVTVWFVAPLSYAWSYKIIRILFFPVRLVWHVVRIVTCPVWMAVRAAWRRKVAVRGSLIRKIHKRAGKGRRSAVRSAAELYRVNR